MNPLHDQVNNNPEVAPEFREVGDRLAPESWHLDAILPPNNTEMVYEDLQPVAAAMQECEVLQEGNEASVFDDEELGVQVVELLGRRCCVAFPCSSILRHLCLHVKVNERAQNYTLASFLIGKRTAFVHKRRSSLKCCIAPHKLVNMLRCSSLAFVENIFTSQLQPHFLQTLDKFFSFQVEIVDDTKRYRHIDIRYT
ncbi:unnamed protein product, partial [Hapterophycus canaliculatus]